MAGGRTVLLAGLGLAVVAVGGYFAAGWYVDHQLETRLQAVAAKLPPGYTLVWKTAHAGLISGNVTVDGIALTLPLSNTADQAVLHIDRAEAINPSRDLDKRFDILKAPPATVTPDAVIPIMDALVLTKIAVTVPKVGVTIDRYRLDGVRVRPWSMVQPAVPTFQAVIDSLKTIDAKSDPTVLLPLLRWYAAVALASEVDHVEMDGLAETVSVPANGEVPGADVAVALQRQVSDGIHHGKFGASESTGFSESVSDLFAVTIARATSKPIDFGPVADRVVAGDPLAPALLDGLAIDPLVISQIGITIQKAAPITLASVELGPLSFDKNGPASGHLGFETLKINAGQIPYSDPFFKTLNLTGTTSDLAIDYSAVTGKNAGDIKARFAVAELGAIDTEYAMLLPSIDAADPAAASTSQPALTQAMLRFTDSSLVDRLLKAGAAASNEDVEAVRKRAIDTVRKEGQALGPSPAAKQILAALVTFLQTPKSLTIEAKPPVPVPVDQMEAITKLAPADMIGLLGIGASANQ